MWKDVGWALWFTLLSYLFFRSADKGIGTQSYTYVLVMTLAGLINIVLLLLSVDRILMGA